MYRNEADLVMGFNCLALAALETESRLLAEGFIPTHNHKLVQTDNLKAFIYKDRYAYSRYFNAKYSRKGRLGERECFRLEVDGVFHTQTALNYVIRQGLHHGLASTPFDYPYCSANSFFRKELGKTGLSVLCAKSREHRFLPHGKKLPESFRMSASGLILKEQVLDTAYVEEIYITPRNYLYQMNRQSDERIAKEQMAENGLPPVTLDSIEKGVIDFDVRAALISEQGRVNKTLMTDLDLCRIIDEDLVPQYLKESEGSSIYLLSDSKRAEIGDRLWRESKNSYSRKGLLSGKTITAAQIRRCLAL
jgi:hypothetical protein